MQVEALPNFVHVPDEIASTYSESFLLAEAIQEAGLINQEQLAQLRELDEVLACMSEDETLWTDEALKHGADWSAVRTRASDLLSLLGEQQRTPELNWLTYVPGGDTTGA
ncbi:MAG TPA: hypothetical protein VF707_11515 [Ardenticatenaceae bacterium]